MQGLCSTPSLDWQCQGPLKAPKSHPKRQKACLPTLEIKKGCVHVLSGLACKLKAKGPQWVGKRWELQVCLLRLPDAKPYKPQTRNPEASGSREVGLGGIGVRRSGLVVRHIDFQIGETSIYQFPKVNCLRSKIVFSVWHSEPENLLVSTST